MGPGERGGGDPEFVVVIGYRRIVNKIVNVQLTIIFDQRIIPRLAYRPCLVPIGSIRGVAQPGSATALGAVGREFESLHPDQI